MTLAHTGTVGGRRAPLVTLSLFGFERGARLWAFTQMGLARRGLASIDGLRFWQLLGSGYRGGFGPRPDWGRYGLLAVWDDPAHADAFFAKSAVIAAYRRRSSEMWTGRFLPLGGHGAWAGSNPFEPFGDASRADGPVAVLTRATIRWTKIAAFWKSIPASAEAAAGADGLLASIGIGESPVARQATFSLWRSVADMQAFAYRSDAHREAIRRTRDEGWYGEELFMRFQPVESEGLWDGRDPLQGFLP